MTPWLRRNAHRVFHPLAGANFGTLAAVLRHGGGVSPRHFHRAGLALGAAAIRSVPDLVERRRFARRRVARPAPPPLFVLGHWRSGTTHLFNLLAQNPQLGFAGPLAVGLPWGFLGMGGFWRRRIEEWLPPDRIIDAMPVTPDSPQEDELALALMQPLSYYHGIFFPRRLHEAFAKGVLLEGCTPEEAALRRQRMALFVEKLQRQQGERRLLLKNPVHTAQVEELRAIWPDAAFVHIHRCPFEVFASTRRMLLTLLREFALQPYDPAAVDELVLDLYPAMMRRLDRATRSLPSDRFVEVRYEDLRSDPLGVVGRIHDALRLDGMEAARPGIERHLAAVRGHRIARNALDAGMRARLARRWGFAFERWAYPAG
ncbi:sulfotransferase family protein [Arenibaculum pallidiluteum]|uniref:sulfotransferase family protein n=1 Tax=Arenibaculum pallidiluteum TaxID=2812559 RepID=UPI001A9582CF|nr:sulfotransferase [Arenibaculum pallidiluteum]